MQQRQYDMRYAGCTALLWRRGVLLVSPVRLSICIVCWHAIDIDNNAKPPQLSCLSTSDGGSTISCTPTHIARISICFMGSDSLTHLLSAIGNWLTTTRQNGLKGNLSTDYLQIKLYLPPLSYRLSSLLSVRCVGFKFKQFAMLVVAHEMYKSILWASCIIHRVWLFVKFSRINCQVVGQGHKRF